MHPAIFIQKATPSVYPSQRQASGERCYKNRLDMMAMMALFLAITFLIFSWMLVRLPDWLDPPAEYPPVKQKKQQSSSWKFIMRTLRRQFSEFFLRKQTFSDSFWRSVRTISDQIKALEKKSFHW